MKRTLMLSLILLLGSTTGFALPPLSPQAPIVPQVNVREQQYTGETQ